MSRGRGVNAEEFGRRAEEWLERGVKRSFNDETRKVALGLFTLIVQGSPVLTGRFRGSWDMELGGYSSRAGLGEEGTGGNRSSATRSALGRAGPALAGLRTDEIVDFVGISNPMDYGPALEYGRITGGSARSGGQVLTEWSRKSGTGFVRTSVEAMRSRIKAGRIG